MITSNQSQPELERQPPATMQIRYCQTCGRDDRVSSFKDRHYSRGELCVGVPATLTYALLQQLASSERCGECVSCGHSNVNRRGFCREPVAIRDSVRAGVCGCKCEYPATGAQRDLGVDTNLPLSETLRLSVEWLQHLHDDHDCDCHGWEQRSFLIEAAQRYRGEIASTTPKQPLPTEFVCIDPPIGLDVFDYFNGVRGEIDSDVVLAHLNLCAQCAETARGLREIDKMIRGNVTGAAQRHYFCSCGVACTAEEYIEHYFEKGHDRGAGRDYIHEDELPADMSKEDYDKWYAQSWLSGGNVGVRVGPRPPSTTTTSDGELGIAWHRDGIGPDVPVLQPRYDALITERNRLCAELNTARQELAEAYYVDCEICEQVIVSPDGDEVRTFIVCGCCWNESQTKLREAQADVIREAVDVVNAVRERYASAEYAPPSNALNEVTAALESLLDKKEGEDGPRT